MVLDLAIAATGEGAVDAMPNALHHRASLLKHRANADLRESGCEEAQREGDGNERARRKGATEQRHGKPERHSYP